MTTLTDEQDRRARELLDSYRDRAETHEQLFEQGNVSEALSTFFSGLAGKYEKIGILLVHVGRIDEARANFGSAAENYLASAREYDPEVVPLSSLPLAKGLYAAALAGDETLLQRIGDAIDDLHENHQVEPDDSDADRFFLAGCLAGVIADDVPSDSVERLEAINRTKPDVESLYGRAIVAFAGGIRNDESARLERGIESMLEYHDRQRDEDSVPDLVMAPRATALFVIARQRGYEIDVDSEEIPMELVEASAGEPS